MELGGQSYLLVDVDGEQFGLDTSRVRTVVEHREPTPIPACPSPFVGALNHHGELLPVVPLSALLGRTFRLDPLRSVIVVVDWGDSLVGLLVGQAHGLLTSLERARAVHVLGRWNGPHLLRTLEVEGCRIHVLDLDSLLDDLSQRL